MKKLIILLPLVVMLVAGLVISACSPKPAAPAPGAAPAPAPAPGAGKTEILLGAINAMTGMEAMVGNEHRWAYQQAVNDINAKGGVYVKELGKSLPLKLIVMDDESDVAKASAAAEKLIKLENVDFILGSVTTPLNTAGAAVAEKYKRLYITTTFFPEMFLEQKFTWVVDSFFYAGKLMESSVAGLEVIPAADRPKNFAVLVGDNPDGHGFGGGAKGILGAFGYNLALYEPFIEGSKDFSASLLRMKAANVDGLITLISSTDGIALVRQIKENKYNLKYIWGAKGFWPIEFGEALGADADYLVSDGHWAEALGAPGSKELGEKYRAQFGKTKYSVTIGNFYSLVQHLAQAIEAAGSLDNAKVRDVYYSGTFVAKNTTEGDISFTKEGVGPIEPVALQWMGGARMPVVPITPDVWKLKLMPPWDKR
ncbi:MAG TPA: amino acid ABC transporter substrate-binding protein [Dehalococcoidales bacterium]|nr:amino acid ABC transporter substrate-binding protein [Dehalococcoidales bacterium]